MCPITDPVPDVTPDRVIARSIKLIRLDRFEVQMLHGGTWSEENRVVARVEGKDPNTSEHVHFSGSGPTMGHACEQALQSLYLNYGLDPADAAR